MPFVTDRVAEQGGVRLGNRDTDDVARHLGEGIIGQEHAVNTLARAASLARAGLTDSRRPLASVLLVGPTGVGKTELARRLASLLRSGPDDMCRIDMNGLAQEHYAASFSGAPPGYAGSKEGFSVFERSKIEGDPYTPGIVLFDEVEKAHGTVLRSLLHVLDHGELRLANGQGRIDFRNCFIILTSNLGSRKLSRLMQGPLGHVQRLRGGQEGGLSTVGRSVAQRASHYVAKRAVQTFFDPEFLNRIDEVVVMNHLDAQTCARIVELQVEELRGLAARKGVDLTVSPSVLDLLRDEGFSAVYGARGLRRALRVHLAVPVAEAMLVKPDGQSGTRHLHARMFNGSVKVTMTTHRKSTPLECTESQSPNVSGDSPPAEPSAISESSQQSE